MRIFVSGCVHGCWETVYKKVCELLEGGETIDLILVAGDAETMRTEEDLLALDCPPYYRILGSFYKFYTGELRMPCLTIVIGGNHEASDVFHALPFGGWVAPNIFYTGRASSLKIGTLTLTGVSGIYDAELYHNTVSEAYPIRSEEDMRSAVYVRAFSDFQVLGLRDTLLMLTHDWPSGITKSKGRNALRRIRAGLIRSDDRGEFGNPREMDIVGQLKPQFWCAAHHHVKWQTEIGDTDFRAVSKPFGAYSKKARAKLGLQEETYMDWFDVIDVDAEMGPLQYRGEWISILKATKSFMEDPSLLKDADWQGLWSSIELPECSDCDVGEMSEDLFAQTASFCRRHGVYCPNREIREFMERSEDVEAE